MTDNFEFRSIHPDEVEQAIAIEQICFPPNEADVCFKENGMEYSSMWNDSAVLVLHIL